MSTTTLDDPVREDEHAAAQRAALDADWGVIRAEGADAAAFLQGQLTNDVASLDASHAMLAGYCSAKGRLLATFVVRRPAADVFLLACASDVLAATLKRLSMFVLRAKCKLSDASGDVRLHAAIGDAVPAAVRHAKAWQMVDGAWLRWPSAGDGTVAAWRWSSASQPARAAIDGWRAHEVRSGVPRIVAATSDAFVPQMVNFELVGGVSFRKGCYPGQEVVARSQYRGTLKRRMFLFASEQAVAPGAEVFHESDSSQPAGTVVNAAAGDGRFVALVSMKSALSTGTGSRVHATSSDGVALTQLAMPYEVPHDAAA